MNIAELETAALSGKFRELRASGEKERERARGKKGWKIRCRDKLSKRRATPRVNWLSAAILDRNLVKDGRTHLSCVAEDGALNLTSELDVDEAPRRFPSPPLQLSSARKPMFASNARILRPFIFSQLTARVACILLFALFSYLCQL